MQKCAPHMFGYLLNVWMPPECLDAPCTFGCLHMFGWPPVCLDAPICLPVCLHTPDVWMPPLCRTPPMFRCPHMYG